MILILADSFDTHADVVEQRLKEIDALSFRLNLDIDALLKTTVHFDNEGWHIEQAGALLASNDIRCVWPRRLTVSLTLEQQNEPEARSFRLWRSEWNRCLYGLYASLRDRFWMNPIANSTLADNKYYQFEVARSVGFRLPPMISSNKKFDLLEFQAKHGEVAVKFMSQDMYRLDDGKFAGIYVNKASRQDIEAFGDLRENPLTLQKYINKQYEVRHTFVAGAHFSCRIDSQKSSRASVDWRRYDLPQTPHSIMFPPSQVTDLVEQIMLRLGLIYGAFDFIVDEEGEWWYLEVNSAGQWLWIEDLVELPISSAIATVLATRAKG